MNDDQAKEFKKTLMSAYALIKKPIYESDPGFTQDHFDSYMQTNEYLLAMEELDSIIDENPDPGIEFWEYLIAAAQMLGHEPSLKRYVHIKSLTT